MPEIRVRSSDFTKGSLPGICARTGVIARDNYTIAASGRLAGAVPMSAQAATGVRRLQQLTLGSFAMAAVTICIALVTRTPFVGFIAVAMLAEAMFSFGLTRRNAITAELSPDGEWVTLSGVHPHFAKAVTSPASPCDGCTNNGACSIAEMAACEGPGSHSH